MAERFCALQDAVDAQIYGEGNFPNPHHAPGCDLIRDGRTRIALQARICIGAGHSLWLRPIGERHMLNRSYSADFEWYRPDGSVTMEIAIG